MKKVIKMVALAGVMASSLTAGALLVSAQESTEPALEFTGVYMGGEDWTVTGANPPITTNWGAGLGLTFTTNAYYIDAGGYQKPIQDNKTSIPNGAGDFKTNKELVSYIAKDGSTDRSVQVIWWDTNGNLSFRLDNMNDPAALSDKTEPISGIKYYKYGDGDRVTVDAGFTFDYSDGTANKKLVLKDSVTVEYSLEQNDWYEVVPEGEKAKINYASGDDVTISAPTYNGMWGFVVSLYGKSKKPAPFTDNSISNDDYLVKDVSRTDLCQGTGGWGCKYFCMLNRYATMYTADGHIYDFTATNDEIFLSKQGVCLRPNGMAAAQEGDKILLKKGFRDVYYYGHSYDAGVKLASTPVGAMQTTRVLGEDVLFVYKNNAWEKADLAPAGIDFSDKIKDLSKIYSNQQIQLSFNKEVNEIPEITSSNNDIVAYDAKKGGLKGGKVAGNATITVKFTLKTLVLNLENKTDTPTVNSIEAKVNAAYGAVVLYKGETPNASDVFSQITVNAVLDNGFAGLALALTADNIKFADYDCEKVYDGTSESEQTIKIVYESKEASVPVRVFAIQSAGIPVSDNVTSWGAYFAVLFSSISADTSKGITFLSPDDLQKLNQKDKIILKKAAANGGDEYEINQVGYIYTYQFVVGFNEVSLTTVGLGDTLTLKKGFRMYYMEEEAYIASAELKQDVKFVWNGNAWTDFTAEAESIQLDQENISLPVGAYYKIPYSVLPAGSYVQAVVLSSDPNTVAVSEDMKYITILKTSETPIEITLRLGNNTATEKKLTINITEEDVVGYQIFTEINYTLGYGGKIELTYYSNADTTSKKLQAVPVFENGETGVPFELNDENTVIGDYDATKVGNQNVTLTITHDNITQEAQLEVLVKPKVEQIPGVIMQDPFASNEPMLYIDFNRTFSGLINVPQEIVEQYKLADYVKFFRGETEIPMQVKIAGSYIIFEPIFAEDEEVKHYSLNDKFVVSVGMPVVLWTGNDRQYAPIGNGQYIVAGEVTHEIVFICTSEVDKSWDTFIQYVGISVENESIDIGIGKMKDLGATTIPSYATIGKFKIVSSNPEVVSVTATNLIKGEALGTAVLTITLEGGENGAITKEVTVNVIDTVSGISLSAKGNVYVKKGTALTGSLLKELGVKGSYVWTSGKVEGEVDLTNVTILGYTSTTNGEQEITLRINYNNTPVTGKIKIIVNDSGVKPSKGCKSSISASSMLLFSAFVGVMTIGMKIRRKSKKED